MCKKKGGQLCLFITALGGGGAERVMLTLVEGLASSGHEVDLVVTNARGPLVSEVPQSVRLIDLRSSRIVASLPAFVRYLRQERPKAIISALAPSNCIAVCARAIAGVQSRLVLSEHSTLSLSAEDASNWRGRALPALMRRAYPRADAVVAVSAGVADDLTESIGLPRNRIDVIHNPVVTPRMLERSREPVEHPWFARGEPPVILGVGRLIPAKDFQTLIRAFAEVRRTQHSRLMILGEGDERDKLQSLIRELGLESEVAMPGFVDNPYAYMRACALFVLSSRWEGLPTVLIEALACGTPVVSTDCRSGPREILEDGVWGRLVPVGSSGKLAASITETLNVPNNLDYERSSAFGLDQAVSKYMGIVTNSRL